jgi:hypothetical protein
MVSLKVFQNCFRSLVEVTHITKVRQLAIFGKMSGLKDRLSLAFSTLEMYHNNEGD